MKNQHSIEIFTKTLYLELKKSNLRKNLNPSLFIIWFSKLIIYFGGLEKIDSDLACEVEKYSKPRSKKCTYFLWGQSFASVLENATRDNNITVNDSTISFLYRKLKISISKWLCFSEYLFLLLFISVYVYLLNKEVIVFCNRRIDSHAVKNFYESGPKKLEKKVKYVGVRSYNLSNLNTYSGKSKSLNKTVKYELIRILKVAAKKSLSDFAVSDYDALITHDQLITAIDNFENYFPCHLFRSKGWLSSYILEKFRYKGRLVIIDDGGEVIRNSTLLKLCQNFSFNLYGCQHGGQYGELRSINAAFEITNAAYDLGFLGWGFGLNYANLKPKPKYDNVNVIGFKNCKGIVYPQSVESNRLDNSSPNIEVNDKIEKNKINILRCLKETGFNYWVKPHPKSHYKDIYNVDSKQLLSGGFKPNIDSKSVSLVIFDSPGQTLMYRCVDLKVNFIFCFSLSSYKLTEAGENYYNNLAENSLFIDSDLSDYKTKLELAISNSFHGEYSPILNSYLN